MRKVNAPAEHERTPSDDVVESAFLALSKGLRRHAATAEGAVEPNSVHSMLAALLYDAERDVRMGGNHHTIDCRRNSGQVRVGLHAFNLRSIWIDREDLISTVFQPAVK